MKSVHVQRNRTEDGFHKWLVFSSAYVTEVLGIGFLMAIGSLFLAIMAEYEATRAQAAVIQSTVFAVIASSGIVAGPFVKKFGTRKAGLVGAFCSSIGVTVSYFATSITFLVSSIGIVAGFGFCFLSIAATTTTAKRFEGEKRKLVLLSILASGASMGGMMYPYFLLYLNDVYGLNGTLLLVGAICAHSIPCSLLWFNQGATVSSRIEVNNSARGNTSGKDGDMAPERNYYRGSAAIERGIKDNQAFDNNSAECPGSDNDIASSDVFTEPAQTICISGRISDKISGMVGKQGLNFVDNNCNTKDNTACESMLYLLKNKSFISFMVALAVSFPTFIIPFIFIVDIFVDKGYTETDAILGLLLLNVLGILGRLYPVFILQFPKLPTIAAPIMASFVAALSMFGLTLLPDVNTLLLGCSIIGFCQGMATAALLVLPAKLFGTDNLPTALGILFTSTAIGNVTVGPVSGMIRDSSSSYNVPLYSAAGCQIVAGGMFIVAHVLRRKTRKSEERRGSLFYVTKL